MKKGTLAKLIKLNQEFYTKTSIYFDDSRSRPWDGWINMLKQIESYTCNIENCIDIGSGNGRFGVFLKKYYPNIKYTGLDFNKALIKLAKKRLTNANVTYQLIQKDLLTNWSRDTRDKFGLSTAFGIIHHIPGLNNRKTFLKQIIDTSSVNGIIVIAAWQFKKLKRFSRLPAQNILLKELGITQSELEQGDYILDWRRGTNAYRYCHYVDEQEFISLIPSTHKIINIFEADGKSDNINKYYILKHK